ncbi:MAG: hypothetical protein AB7V46_00400 [Thermomicrobiales bacterium]
MSEWTITLTRQQDGTYLAERDGREVIVPVTQRFEVESIDLLRAEYEAAELLSEGQEEGEAALEIRERRVLWKVAAYDEVVRRAVRDTDPELLAKQAYWHAEAETFSDRTAGD